MNKATAAVPTVTEQLTPEFDKHAADYVAAVDLLPENLNAESLLQSGAAAATAYGIAKDEAVWLNHVSSWVTKPGTCPGSSASTSRSRCESCALRMRCSFAAQLKTLGVDSTLHAIKPVFYTAAREGIEFGINTLRECADIRRALAFTPAKATFR